MATHIKFKRKQYSTVSKIKKINPVIPISLGTLSVSTANFVTNKKRSNEDKKYQGKQLEAMNRLTNSLNKVDQSLKITAEKKPTKKNTILGRVKLW